MSCKEKEVEIESGAEKRREAEEASRPEPEPERPNGATEPVHWLVQAKEKMGRQFNTFLAAAAVMMLLSLLITAMWVVPVITTQNKKIALIEARLERDMKTSNGELWEEFQRMKNNHTSQISELESKLQTMQQELAIGAEKLLHAETEISVLKERVNNENKKLLEHERKLAEVAESLREKEELLQEALARAAAFEEQHNKTMERVSTLELNHLELSVYLSLTRAELNSTASEWQGKVEDLEERLRNTTARTVTLEEELDDVERDIATVNATKASREEVSQQVAQLDRDKVDRTEFQELSANLTSLAETSSRADEELQQELRELSESALNHTHYNQIQQDLASKASQVEVELLANSTVRTTTFLQRVEGIENTIVQVQWNISQLTFNLTHLEGRVQQISITLETKAGQQDVNALSGRVTSLEGSTVDKDTFQQLIGTVQGIQDTKADESDLNQLKRKVDSLSYSTATKTELRSLDTKLKNHISSSDGTHRELSSSIRSNSGSISGNTNRISQIETEPSSSVAGLTVPWLTTAVMTLVAVCHAY